MGMDGHLVTNAAAAAITPTAPARWSLNAYSFWRLLDPAIAQLAGASNLVLQMFYNDARRRSSGLSTNGTGFISSLEAAIRSRCFVVRARW